MGCRPRAGSVRAGRRAVAGALLASALLAVPAVADPTPPAEPSVPYTCDFPVLGARVVSVVVGADLPVAVPVGAPSDGFPVRAAITLPAEVVEAMGAAGGTRVSGSVEVGVAVAGAEQPRTVPVQAPLAEAALPATGEVALSATGVFPEQVLRSAGLAQVSARGIALSLDPVAAPAWAPPSGGRVQVRCAPHEDAEADLGTTEVSASVDWAAPTELTVTATTATSVSLSWAPPGGRTVAAYEVRVGDSVVATVTEPTATLGDLRPGTEHSFTVQARDDIGRRSRASEPATARTPVSVVRRAYDIAAVTHHAALDLRLSLTGRADAELDVASGLSAVELELHDTSVRTRMFGLIPVEAVVAFDTGGTTATLSQDGLAVSTRVSVVLPSITLFGYPVSSGSSCRTSVPADIALHSDGAFDPLKGGSMSGTYTIPALAGCGDLTKALTAMASGPGNTLDLTLTVRPD
ncbi:DUF6801 domain-containing protein [Actinokineospora sp. G85]|uniref:DUF6801 domain-containing protein n=1 Tax=Actinokineospora sp. G85 TaxID=3406626 RepID=UPI003C7453CA